MVEVTENRSDTFEIGGELTVHRLGFGAMRLTGEDIIGRPDDEEAARALVRQAADAIAAGEKARLEVSMSKVFTANVTQEAVDTALQFCGANGIGKDLPLADFYESIRAFRIVDGADEVHLRTAADHVFEETDPDELDPVTRFGQ